MMLFGDAGRASEGEAQACTVGDWDKPTYCMVGSSGGLSSTTVLLLGGAQNTRLGAIQRYRIWPLRAQIERAVLHTTQPQGCDHNGNSCWRRDFLSCLAMPHS
jgi:hypothetical protein